MASRLQDPVVAHLQHLEVRGLSPMTLLARRGQLRRLAGHLGVELGEDLLLATAEDLDEWQQHMVRYSLNFRISAAAHVREFYRFALRRGYLTEDPSEVLVSPRQPVSVPQPIGEQDLDTAIAFAPPRVRPMLVLAAYCGLRAMEIAGLTREGVLDSASPPVLVVLGKGNKQRVVPLPDHVLTELRTYGLPSTGLVFPRGDGGANPNTAHRISGLCNEYLHGLGIGSSLHKLRHFYGTSMYAASKDLLMVQNMMGHSNPQTTSGYVAYDRQAAHEAAALIGAAAGARPTPRRLHAVHDASQTPAGALRLRAAQHSGELGVLTPRELDVLRLLAEGKANTQIAYALGVSSNTVKSHLQRIAQKLGTRGRTGLVALALRAGLVA